MRWPPVTFTVGILNLSANNCAVLSGNANAVLTANRKSGSGAAIYIETHGGTGVAGSDDHAGVDIGRTFTRTPAAAARKKVRIADFLKALTLPP